jgi:uncharacterized protein
MMTPRNMRGLFFFVAVMFAVEVNAADTRLLGAAKEGDKKAVRDLLNARADVNAATPDGTTALHWAVYNDDLEITRMLLDAGAKATASNRYGVTPIYPASVNGNPDILKMLLKFGANANTTSAEGETVLMTAARTGKVDAVNVLLDAGADLNVREEWRGQTALMWAAAEGHTDVVRALIKRGADIHARSKLYYEPSEAQFRQSEQQHGGFTALLFAAREGRIGAAQALLEAGANINDTLQVIGPGAKIIPEPGLNVFMLAAANAHYELAAMLLERGLDPNMAPQGWTALHQLSWVRKPGDVGHSAPAPEGSGKMTSFEFARLLGKHGADVNARATTRRAPAVAAGLNMVGATPFLLAARTKDANYMRLLVELGADPKLPNTDGTTPLMTAAGIGMSAAEDGETEADLLEALRVTLALGNDINAVDNNGETAMHGAAYKLIPSAVRFLSQNGAKIEVWTQPNKKGQTPLDITQRNKALIGAAETEAALRDLMTQAGISPAAAK